MKQQGWQAPRLPGTERPSFGGVQLRPGFEPRKPSTQDWSGFMQGAREPEADQTDFLDMAEQGALAAEYGDCPEAAQLDHEIEEFYGPAISIYTRAQAIEDGALVDVSEWASPREMMGGFTVPVCMTRALWAKVEAPKGSRQDTRGRAHDVLWMASLTARKWGRAFPPGHQLVFGVKIGNRRIVPVVVLDGDGVTIGFPEDF